MVVVGTPPLARSHLLPSAINALAETNPEVRVSVVDGRYDDLLHGLRNGDLGVLVGALRDPSPVDDVFQAPLLDDPFAVVERRDDPLASKNRISPARLASYPRIIARHGTPTCTRFEELFDAHTGLCPTSIVESSSLVLIRGVLLNSDRLTILSARQTRHEVARRTLRFCLHRTSNRIRHQRGCG